MSDKGEKRNSATQTEMELLGRLLRGDKFAIAQVLAIVQPDDFSQDANQKILSAIIHLFDTGQAVDGAAAAQVLDDRKQLDDVRPDYIGDLLECSSPASNAEFFAHAVRDRAIVRDLTLVGQEIARDASERRGPAEELLAEAEKKIIAVALRGFAGRTRTVADGVSDALARYDARSLKRGACTGVTTGLFELDGITSGLQDSELIVVAARPSVGKTTLGLHFIRIAALEGLPVYFASLEQSYEEVMDRLICAQARVNSHLFRKGSLGNDDHFRAIQAASILRQTATIVVDDAPGLTMLRLSAAARRFKLQHGIRLAVVDYLQLIEEEMKKESRRQSRQEQVARISRRLKLLARELKIPVVALAQLNRGPEDRADNEPRLSDLRESGAIEADADTVLLLHKPKDKDGIVEAIVAKQRNGPTGKVDLVYEPAFMRFEDFVGA